MTLFGDAVKIGLVAEALRSSGMLRVRVFGNSMMPWIWPGDILIVQEEKLLHVRPGEVVLYAREGRLFAHRVVRKHWRDGQPFVTTRGDSLSSPDPPVSSGELLGRVVRLMHGNREINLENKWRTLLDRMLLCMSPDSSVYCRLATAVKRVWT